MTLSLRALALCAAALALTACDRPAAFDRPLDASPPIGLDRHVTWMLRGQPALFVLTPDTMATAYVPLPGTPGIAVPDPQGTGLLVVDDQPAAHWIRFDDNGPLEPVAFPLSAPYGRAVYAPDGRRVVLYQGPGDRTGVLTNPNQIAIVDLDTGAVIERTLRSFGGSPTQVVISDRAPIAGAERQLGWALSDRYLALFDLAAPEAREVIVHLTLEADTRTVIPVQVELADVGEGPAAFVRAQGADDIFALGFDADAPAGEVPRPFLNQLPAGQAPSDVAVLTVDAGPRVFAVEPALPGLSVIDPATASRLAVTTDLPVQNIEPFDAPREDGTIGRFALLWQAGASGVVFADLDRLEDERGRALTPLVLGGGLQTLQPVPGRRQAVARVGGNRVVMLDFDDRTATPLDADDTVESLLVAPEGDTVFLTTVAGSLAALNTERLTATTVALTPEYGSIYALVHVPGARRLVAVLRGDGLGRVVVTPDADFTEESLERRDGLFLEGMFDR